MFTLREPPEESGNYKKDISELIWWCRELYESLWLSNFSETMQRKKKGTEDEG